jgi:cobalt-zinc-cadmium efflux system outer membrane protein
MRAYCLLYLAVGLLITMPRAYAQEGETLSLDAAVERALRISPQMTASAAEVDAAGSLAVSAGKLPDPQLILGLDNLPVSGPDAYSTTADFMTMRRVGVMQAFPRGEKRRLQRERAQTEVDLARAEEVETRLDVARETAQAWIRRATSEAALDELHALQSEVELGAAAARASLAAGKGSSAEALSAEAAVARLKNRTLQMQGESRQAQAQLARWIADDATRPLAPPPSFDGLPVPPETLLTTPHLHGAILPFEAKLAEARTDVELARAERRPDWSTELSFAKRGPAYSDMVSLQVSIGLPLFAKTRQNPVIAARAAGLRRIEAERDAELRMHTAELQQEIVEWEQTGAQLEQYREELLPLARERSQVSLAAYRTGRGELRPALEAFEDEVDLLIEQAALQNQRGRAWAFLRYLEAQHVHAP